MRPHCTDARAESCWQDSESTYNAHARILDGRKSAKRAVQRRSRSWTRSLEFQFLKFRLLVGNYRWWEVARKAAGVGRFMFLGIDRKSKTGDEPEDDEGDDEVEKV